MRIKSERSWFDTISASTEKSQVTTLLSIRIRIDGLCLTCYRICHRVRRAVQQFDRVETSISQWKKRRRNRTVVRLDQIVSHSDELLRRSERRRSFVVGADEMEV